MKFSLSFIFFLTGFLTLKAQHDQLLPVDDRGKFIYYEVVELKNLSKDSLKMKALNFFNKKNNLLTSIVVQGDTSFSANGKFVISKTVLVMSHPSGEIPFYFQTEIKEGKYRFWLTDFTFIPYQRDRYGNFVPNTPIGVPLENIPGKLNAVQWKEYQAQTALYAKNFAIKFKEAMAKQAPIASILPEKKVVKKDW